jgi:beta-phosphoglucomutase
VAEVTAQKGARFQAALREHGLDLLLGVGHRLGRLRERGRCQATTSSASRANLDLPVVAAGLADASDMLVDPDRDAMHRGEPDPELFLDAAEHPGVPTARCVVAEGSTRSVATARRAGVQSIAVGPAHEALPGDVRVASLAARPDDAFGRLLVR